MQLKDKLQKEYDAFISSLTTVEDAIRAHYKITICMEVICIANSGCDFLNEDEAEILTDASVHGVLAKVYQEWLETDSTDLKDLEQCIKDVAQREMRKLED